MSDWATVVRTPALMTQIDYSTTMIQEIEGFLLTLSTQKSEYAKNATAKSKKRSKQVEKSIADAGSASTAAAVHQVKECIDKDIEATEKEAKAVEGLCDCLVKLTEVKLKQKAEMDSELDKKKKILENAKNQVVRKRREALKEWEQLQDEMKKLVKNRDLASREVDVKKKESFKKNVDKYEAAIFKHKSVVRAKFKEVENLVIQTNQEITNFHSSWLPQHVANLINLEQDKNSQLKSCLEMYIAHQKDLIAALKSSLSFVEDAVKVIDSNADSALFMQSAIPAGQEQPPADILPELPVESKLVEQAADSLLKAGMLTRIATTSSMLDDRKDITSAENSANEDDLYDEEGIPGDGTRYVVLYPYEGNSDPDYAVLKEGEYVVITDSKSDSYWWGGYLENDPNQTEVWIPSEYIGLP